MRRHSPRALALLLSLAPATLVSAALAQTPAGGDPAAPAPSAPSAPVPSAPPGPLAPFPGDAVPAPSPPPAPPAATAPASAAPSAAAPSLAPAPASQPPARVAQPKPLPPRVVAPYPEDAPPAPEAAPIPAVAAWLGINTLWIPSDGFDPFSDDDALTLFDLGAAVSLAGTSVFDVAAVVSWGVASSDADYRTQPAELDVMRFSAGPELRGSIIDRLYWHGRLSPTATRLAASLEESSSRVSLSDSQWAFGVDAAVGLDLRFVETPTPLPNALGFFVRAEAGYGWTQNVDLELEAEGSAAPVRSEALALPELALGGPSLRVSVGAGF